MSRCASVPGCSASGKGNASASAAPNSSSPSR
jgi:hypothetical protein